MLANGVGKYKPVKTRTNTQPTKNGHLDPLLGPGKITNYIVFVVVVVLLVALAKKHLPACHLLVILLAFGNNILISNTHTHRQTGQTRLRTTNHHHQQTNKTEKKFVPNVSNIKIDK